MSDLIGSKMKLNFMIIVLIIPFVLMFFGCKTSGDKAKSLISSYTEETSSGSSASSSSISISSDTVKGSNSEITSGNTLLAKRVDQLTFKIAATNETLASYDYRESPVTVGSIGLYADLNFKTPLLKEFNGEILYVELLTSTSPVAGELSADLLSKNQSLENSSESYTFNLSEIEKNSGIFHAQLMASVFKERLKLKSGEVFMIRFQSGAENLEKSLIYRPSLYIYNPLSFPSVVNRDGRTAFNFFLSSPAVVKLSVLDIYGSLVTTQKSDFTAGWQKFLWNLENDEGRRVKLGVYLFKFETTATSATNFALEGSEEGKSYLTDGQKFIVR